MADTVRHCLTMRANAFTTSGGLCQGVPHLRLIAALSCRHFYLNILDHTVKPFKLHCKKPVTLVFHLSLRHIQQNVHGYGMYHESDFK